MNKQSLASVYLRGIAMGAADIVPGVSGGTVAFVTGIYGRLLDAIRSVTPGNVKLLFTAGPGEFWRVVDGNFLLALLAGILTSVFTLAKLISHLLESYPVLVWAFFLGLIAASSLHMMRQLKRWSPLIVVALVIGALAALGVAEIKPAQLEPRPELVFICGAIAICAMILPGISGSFILVLLGMYPHILAAAGRFDIAMLAIFASGCAAGLLCFSHLLSWLLHHYHDRTLALLTGFLIGSIYMVWPWKHTLTWYQNSHGESVALLQENVWPADFLALTGQDPQTGLSIALVVIGLALVLGLELLAGSAEKEQDKTKISFTE